MLFDAEEDGELGGSDQALSGSANPTKRRRLRQFTSRPE
jgi:hypothetical protein